MNFITKILSRVRVVINAKAIDGPSSGSYVEIQAQYNSSIGAYELLTAGSTSEDLSATNLWNSTTTIWNSTSINWNQT